MIFKKGEKVKVRKGVTGEIKKYSGQYGQIVQVFSLEGTTPFQVQIMLTGPKYGDTVLVSHHEIELAEDVEDEEYRKRNKI